MSEDRSIREIRLEKLAQLRQLQKYDGSTYDPFATEKFKIDHSAKHLLENFDSLVVTEEDQTKPTISFAGRIVALREMGKAAFAHLSDGDDKIQIYVRKNDLDETCENAWPAFKLLDIGDHLGITGYLFTTKTGEPSIHIQTLTPLSKSLHNLPLGKEKDGEQWYGLTDVDQRYRHRHLDLITNREAREQLLNRSRIVSEVRRFFDARGYLEVETPLLQLEAGGAAARPFLTHYNAYDLEVKLRISLELYLKRIICGDVPKVYEIGRVFRNEGVSNRHNPEFTLLEWYEAYANLEDMMTCVEDLFRHVAETIFESPIIASQPLSKYMKALLGGPCFIHSEHLEDQPVPLTFYRIVSSDVDDQKKLPTALHPGDAIRTGLGNFRLISGTATFHEPETKMGLIDCETDCKFLDEGIEQETYILTAGKYFYIWSYDKDELNDIKGVYPIDFGKPWHRVDLMTAIQERSGIAPEELTNMDSAKAAMKRVGLPTEKENNLGGIIEKLLEHFVEPHLQEPTFIVGYPIETSPLAKKDPNRPGFTRRFEGYVLGREICNAFSEINDPIDQRERFEQQLGERDKGDDEAHPMDEQFLFALESGMPPTGGCGIGIDRLVMLLTGAEHLREILLFPMMRPEIHHDNPDIAED
ncbi:MAG: lysine--tRNA ligase [Fimbriimonadaceae bacterium]